MICLCCWTHSSYDQAKPDNKEARTHAHRQTRCIVKLQVGLKPQQSTAYPHSVVAACTHNRFAGFYFYMFENKFRYCGQPPAACYLCIFISVVTDQTCQLPELPLSYFTWQGSSWSLCRHVKNKSFCRTLCRVFSDPNACKPPRPEAMLQSRVDQISSTAMWDWWSLTENNHLLLKIILQAVESLGYLGYMQSCEKLFLLT